MNAPTSNTPYSQSATLAEKLLAHEEATLRAYTQVTNPEPSGRWAKPSPPQDPATMYPRIAGGPWGAGPQLPDEPPFPEDINYVEVCGTAEEVERAAAILKVAASVVSSPGSDEAGCPLPHPATTASPLAPSEDWPPGPSPEVTPLTSATDSTSFCGSTGPSSFTLADQQLAAPLVDAKPSRDCRTDRVELRRGGAAPFSRPSFRRVG